MKMVRDMAPQFEDGQDGQSFMIRRGMLAAVLVGLAVPGALGHASAAASATNAKSAEVLLPGATYDVATIKPSDPGNGNGTVRGTLPGGEFVGKGLTLKSLVCGAYDKFDFQCLGGPSWLNSDRYDIAAKPNSALADQMLKLNWQDRAKVADRMQQTLLEDRIKLKYHEELKVMPIFALVVAKVGVKMTEAKDTGSYETNNGMIQATGISMDSLAELLSHEMGHIVENRTGLKSGYEFTLKYSDDVATGQTSSAPSIYTALEEQLGLKMQSTKGPVQVLVIDHVERPSAN